MSGEIAVKYSKHIMITFTSVLILIFLDPSPGHLSMRHRHSEGPLEIRYPTRS
ncbi:hypothetical protein PHLGIDRAFT_334482 [Phlebiopsis gigantea 11061_1 CR5-6]|uniref:Uncharacterized protein n=1 Tax=Phlebiopsis gigantea (strain 11061_1 CR5-6) TaxID=745531 RepID=A0A0C3SD50_PHLG1|nr:hypothetical protein PHLGIDRAFT_334482 [Phlebiopsis gigantea 11061_1 CR5-6]